VKIKKPIKVSAPEYADYLMTWVQSTLEDETTFPVSDGSDYLLGTLTCIRYTFSETFQANCKEYIQETI
jgi:MOB kinase activator 1